MVWATFGKQRTSQQFQSVCQWDEVSYLFLCVSSISEMKLVNQQKTAWYVYQFQMLSNLHQYVDSQGITMLPWLNIESQI